MSYYQAMTPFKPGDLIMLVDGSDDHDGFVREVQSCSDNGYVYYRFWDAGEWFYSTGRAHLFKLVSREGEE